MRTIETQHRALGRRWCGARRSRGHFAWANARAFSLAELVAVMTVTALLGVAAIPALGGLAATRCRGAAAQVCRDVAFARERAMSTSTRCWVVFSAAGAAYSVLDENPASPGRSGATVITDPATGQPFTRSLGTGETAGVGIVSAVFDSGSEVGFDWMGQPYNSASSLLSVQGVVTLTGNQQVLVQPGTGAVTQTP